MSDLIARLDRAHRMSCSDPSDPTRTTLYGEAADALRPVALPDGAHPLTGKTIATVEQVEMMGRDTFKDPVRWTNTRLHFTDGTSETFADADGEVYDAVEVTDFCDHCGNALVLVYDETDTSVSWYEDANADETCSPMHDVRHYPSKIAQADRAAEVAAVTDRLHGSIDTR